MQSKKAIFIAALCWITAGAVYAKLPPPSDEAKAKAVEAKAKAVEADKKDAEALTKAQDRVANGYIKAQKANGAAVKPAPIASSTSAAAPAKK